MHRATNLFVDDYYKLVKVERGNKKTLDISFSRIRSVDLYEGRITLKYDKSSKVIYRGDASNFKKVSRVLAKEPTIKITESN